MTDAEIYEVMKCYSTNRCLDYPSFDDPVCMTILMASALGLINRQLAEIEKLKKEINELESEVDRQYEQAEADILGNLPQGGASCHWCIDKHKAYAIKEFVERLKQRFYACPDVNIYAANVHIDNLVKEMVGDAE